MKLKFMLPLMLGTAIAALPGCTPPYNQAPASPVINPLYSPNAKTDAKVLGALVALNQGEIAAAAVAQNKATHASVKKFANFLHAAHNQNLQETLNVSKTIGVVPENGNAAIMLQRLSHKELASLNHLSGGAFDRAYIADMVRDHTAGLRLIDSQLLKVASNPVLIKHLEITRNHVADHLRKAEAIQKELGR